jgi:hypothetical protein
MGPTVHAAGGLRQERASGRGFPVSPGGIIQVSFYPAPTCTPDRRTGPCTWRGRLLYSQTPALDEQANPRTYRGSFVWAGHLSGGAEQGAEFAEPVALAVDVHV